MIGVLHQEEIIGVVVVVVTVSMVDVKAILELATQPILGAVGMSVEPRLMVWQERLELHPRSVRRASGTPGISFSSSHARLSQPD